MQEVVFVFLLLFYEFNIRTVKKKYVEKKSCYFVYLIK
jgi:hypothetical protein